MRTETDIWAFIPLADFNVPSSPAGEATRGLFVRTWQSLWSLIYRSNGNKSNSKTDFEHPPDDVLKRISPSFEANRAATLATALGDEWFNHIRPERHLRTVIGPPGFEIGVILSAVAKECQFRILNAPSTDSILEMSDADNKASLSAIESGSDILVIPHLERFFLRHEKGLSLVRDLVARLSAGSRRVLVGCDSWCWAFLKEAIGIEDVLGEPLTLAPFDADRLDDWFHSTADVSAYEIHQRGSDAPVFTTASGKETANAPSKPEVSTLLKSLAAQSRGNPGVAVALWRASLRTNAGPENADELLGKKPQVDLWAVSPSDSNGPGCDIEHTDRFILHAVLLHGGLSQTSIPSLLPFSRDEVRRRIILLSQAYILEEHAGILGVCWASYPWVRKDLCNEGFLTDAF